jgi:hypothetical protein
LAGALRLGLRQGFGTNGAWAEQVEALAARRRGGGGWRIVGKDGGGEPAPGQGRHRQSQSRFGRAQIRRPRCLEKHRFFARRLTLRRGAKVGLTTR